MILTTLALLLGYRCNARCASCLWGEMLARPQQMSIEEACRWIDQAEALGDLMLVGFSGGEPLLFPENLEDVMAYASSRHGLPSVISTNAFWARTPTEARRRLESLYERGLRQMLLSMDDFHQAWIPLDRVRNALAAAADLHIPTTLQCVVTKTSRRLAEYLDELALGEMPNLTTSEIPCTPVGFAADKIPRMEIEQQEGVPADYCTLFQTLIVRPEGIVHLCCGPTFAIDALTAGNLMETDMAEIIEAAEWDPLLNALALYNGPAHLAKTLSEAGAGDLVQAGYATSCHACHHILSQPEALAILREALAPQQAELFLKRTILDQISTERQVDLLKF
jgi:MoaA/NifB/PqqE/SkfB family radical SAM enzyme